MKAVGEVHATIEVTHESELNIGSICERLLPLFHGDDLNYSARALHLEYENMVRQTEARRAAQEAPAPVPVAEAPVAAAPEAVLVVPVPEATPPEATTLQAALRSVSADAGLHNWLLLEPAKLGLHSVGSGGLEDLKGHLDEDKVLFGVVRLSFGRHARSGITKHFLVHWVGPAVSVVRRGVWNARLKTAAALLGAGCSLTFCRQAHRLADLQLEDVVAELRRLCVVDGVSADGIAASRISIEEYRAALADEARERERQERARRRNSVQSDRKLQAEPQVEEIQAAQAVHAVQAPEAKEAKHEVLHSPQPERQLQATLEEVRSATGSLNWVLIGWKRVAPLPPSPCRNH